MEYEKAASQFGDWGPKFAPFIQSDAFDEIFAFLKKQAAKPPDGEGKTICPEHHNVFRAFRETPYKDLKAIFILQDPYPWIKNGKYVADGIPMSCSNTGVCQPSLDLFYDGIADDLGYPVVHHPDLTYLCKQGVLFLNTSLTVELGKPTSHKGIWDKFIYFFIEEVINFYNTGTCYVSLGKNAQVMAKAVIPFLHWGFEVEHPAAAAHKERKWNHQNVFSKINKVLKNNNNTTINWGYGHTETKDVVELPKTGIRGKITND
jgi:uracil-DNA glycosylase